MSLVGPGPLPADQVAANVELLRERHEVPAVVTAGGRSTAAAPSAPRPTEMALTAEEEARVTEDLLRSGTRVLFVGLGTPKQERWMADHRHLPMVMVGVGAAFDFLSGRKRQAPRALQGLGLEWLYRLAQEPRRLWRRYLYRNPRFVALFAAQLLRERQLGRSVHDA
jgi:hypothetical protein